MISEFYRDIGAENQRRWRDKQELQRERRTIIRGLEELDEPLKELLDLWRRCTQFVGMFGIVLSANFKSVVSNFHTIEGMPR